MPPKATKTTSPTKAVPSGTPQSCKSALDGPPHFLDGEIVPLPNRYKESTYRSAGFVPTCGERKGPAAFLSPNQLLLCVVGGDLGGEGLLHTSMEAIPDTGVPEAATPIAAPAAAATAKKKAPKEAPAAKSKAKSVKKPQNAPPVSAASKEPKADEQAAAPPAVNKPPVDSPPPAWRPTCPLVECYNIIDKEWFVPVGVQQRAAVSVRWPQLATASVVSWDRLIATETPSVGPSLGLTPFAKTAEHQAAEDAEAPNRRRTLSHHSELPQDLPALPQHQEVKTRDVYDDDGPAEVCLVGGFNDTHRLATVADYLLTLPERSEELLRTTLPTVEPLTLPPLTHHAMTPANGRLYIFGGDTAQGSINHLYMLESYKLSKSWEAAAAASLTDKLSGTQLLPTHNVNSTPGTMGLTLANGYVCTRLGERPPLQMMGGSPVRNSVTACMVAPAATMPEASSPSDAAAPRPMVPPPAPRASAAMCCLANRFLIMVGGRQLRLPAAAEASPVHTAGGAAAKKKPAKAPPKKVSDEEAREPKMVVYGDVIAYDLETNWWVQVKLTGGESPVPRYGAALCPLPATEVTARPVLGTSLTMASSQASFTGKHMQREILLHGGISETGAVLSDAWVLHTVSRSASSLEMDAESGVPTLPLRWVRLRVDRIVPAPQAPVETAPVHPAPASKGRKDKGQSVPAAEAEPAVQTVSLLPSRCHHALVPTAQRDVYVVGGAAAEEALQTQTASLVILRVPGLQHVTENAGPAGESASAK